MIHYSPDVSSQAFGKLVMERLKVPALIEFEGEISIFAQVSCACSSSKQVIDVFLTQKNETKEIQGILEKEYKLKVLWIINFHMRLLKSVEDEVIRLEVRWASRRFRSSTCGMWSLISYDDKLLLRENNLKAYTYCWLSAAGWRKVGSAWLSPTGNMWKAGADVPSTTMVR